QVHPDRIVRLVERAGRQIELELLGAFGGAIDRLVVAEIFLVRVDHFDAGAAEGVEQIVELVGGGNLRWQQLVHLVVQQIALFLADVNELPYLVVFFFNRHLVVPQSGKKSADLAHPLTSAPRSGAAGVSSSPTARRSRARAGPPQAPEAGRFRAGSPPAPAPTSAVSGLGHSRRQGRGLQA